jgi:predicted nucleic acid-binding protein
MIVIADTSPIRYLVLIGQIDVLASLYGSILMPEAVALELSQSETPSAVREWIAHPPAWLEIRKPELSFGELPQNLGPGECEAIALVAEVGADLLLVDDWAARRAAEALSISTLGTLGILDLGDELGFLDSRDAIERLLTTNFRAGLQLVKTMIDRSMARRGIQ